MYTWNDRIQGTYYNVITSFVLYSNKEVITSFFFWINFWIYFFLNNRPFFYCLVKHEIASNFVKIKHYCYFTNSSAVSINQNIFFQILSSAVHLIYNIFPSSYTIHFRNKEIIEKKRQDTFLIWLPFDLLDPLKALSILNFPKLFFFQWP